MNTATKYAIVSEDFSEEYCGKRNGKAIFRERTIPHNGRRYKTYGNALEMQMRLNADGYLCRTIETLI